MLPAPRRTWHADDVAAVGRDSRRAHEAASAAALAGLEVAQATSRGYRKEPSTSAYGHHAFTDGQRAHHHAEMGQGGCSSGGREAVRITFGGSVATGETEVESGRAEESEQETEDEGPANGQATWTVSRVT